MERLSRETVLALAKAVEAKDKYTNGHSERVARYARLIAEKAGMSEADQDDIYIIGLLHDIGKIGIPDTVLNKTSRLTDEEFAVIKTHTTIGADILKSITESPASSRARGGTMNAMTARVIPTASRATRSRNLPASSAWRTPMTP